MTTTGGTTKSATDMTLFVASVMGSRLGTFRSWDGARGAVWRVKLGFDDGNLMNGNG